MSAPLQLTATQIAATEGEAQAVRALATQLWLQIGSLRRKRAETIPAHGEEQPPTRDLWAELQCSVTFQA